MKEGKINVWDDVWKNTNERYLDNLLKEEEKSLVWKDIQKEIKGFQNLRVLEIGAGSGTYSLLFAKKGARVTVLDLSSTALKISKKLFKRNNINAEFIKTDALKKNTALLNKFDITMSFGLCEHFNGRDRTDIINAHYRYLKNGGKTFITVPNKYCPQYRIWKFLSKLAGRWKFGYENPFSKKEIKKISKKIGFRHFKIIDYRFFETLNEINPLRLFFKVNEIKQKNKSFLDKISQDFILVAIK